MLAAGKEKNDICLSCLHVDISSHLLLPCYAFPEPSYPCQCPNPTSVQLSLKCLLWLRFLSQVPYLPVSYWTRYLYIPEITLIPEKQNSRFSVVCCPTNSNQVYPVYSYLSNWCFIPGLKGLPHLCHTHLASDNYSSNILISPLNFP